MFKFVASVLFFMLTTHDLWAVEVDKGAFFSEPEDSLQASKDTVKKDTAYNSLYFEDILDIDITKKPKNKLVAIALALTLGPFGVHRLYLGTVPKVPIAYTLTLGGGFFILPLIDIFYIIGNRNPDLIENNHYVFIWNKKRKPD